MYFAVNSPAGIVGTTPAAAAATITGWGFPVTVPTDGRRWRSDVGEKTLFYRTAARRRWRWAWRTSSRAAGGGRGDSGFWYHFAIMFEALFILTIIDAGTRVGRFMLQDLLGHV